jgi:hypothetical protein
MKTYVIILNLLFVIAVFSSCSTQKTSSEYHNALQKELSWENYNSPKNRIKRAKDKAKAIEEQKALQKQEEKLRAKIARIENRGNE